MEDFIIVAVLAVIVGLAGYYVYRTKKSGNRCIGCPHSAICKSAKCGCCNKEK